MKKFLNLLFFTLFFAAYQPAIALAVDTGDQVASVIDTKIDLPVIPASVNILPTLNNKCIPVKNELIASIDQGVIMPYKIHYYTAGLSLKDINWNSSIVLYAITLLLGLLIGAVVWKRLSVVSAKVGAGLEAAAQMGYQGASTVNNMGLTSTGTLLKEGSEIVDELGDVATILAQTTADGKFDVEDAKRVLKEGKDVVVALKDFLLVVKPKITPVV